MRPVYENERVRVSYDDRSRRFEVLAKVAGKSESVDAGIDLVELGQNAREACRRMGIDPDERLVPASYSIILPREVQGPWSDCQALAEAAEEYEATKVRSSWTREFREAFDRFGSSEAARQAEATREYDMLFAAGL